MSSTDAGNYLIMQVSCGGHAVLSTICYLHSLVVKVICPLISFAELKDEKKRSIHANVVDDLLGALHDSLCHFLLQGDADIISFVKHS